MWILVSIFVLMVCVRWPCPIVRFSFTVHESNIQKWLHHTQNRLFTCNSDTLFDFRSFVCCPENVPHGGTMSGAGGSFAMNYSLVDHMDNSPPYDHFIAIGCWPFYKFAYICILFDQLWWCLECNLGSKTVFFVRHDLKYIIGFVTTQILCVGRGRR